MVPESHPVRSDVRDWLAEHPDPDPESLADAGLVAPSWPEPWGRSATPLEALAISIELTAAGIDPHAHNPIGIGWAGPTILAAGTDAQRDRYLRPILDGTEFWCQLFSEPDAGSDLASLSTRAVRDGDEYVVSGQKIWNTYAERADLGILLVRTGHEGPRHAGITYLLCPMDAPGIEVRPIRQMTGELGFCEVFFDEARIPVGNRLGGEGDGWPLARLTLGNERMTLSTGGVLWGRGPSTDEVLRRLAGRVSAAEVDRAARLHVEAEVLRLLSRRIVSEIVGGRDSALLAAIRKYLADQHGQEVMDLLTDALGAEGLLDDGDRAWGFLYSRALTIGGGTTQVLADLIAERALGLPR